MRSSSGDFSLKEAIILTDGILMKKRLQKSRYISGFDGVRTLAVVGVILYHLFPYNMKGGFLGVPIFFVVSGYLITDLLLQEYEQNGTIDIRAFYARRMKRLYPALLTMVLTTAAFITIFARASLGKLRDVIINNVFYVYNWFQVANHESYFDKFGNQSPFTHLWSLSIEGQFYLFWPIIVILLLKFVHSRQTNFDIVLISAFVSAIWMIILFSPNQDPSRIYYGTDTRIFSILLGAALAFLWPSTKLKKNLQSGPRLFLDGLGLGSLLLIVWMFFTMDGENDLLYLGGMFFFSLLAMLLVATIAHPGADIDRLMSNRVFSWIGKRSYGIYLYQYPIMIFYEQKSSNLADHPILNAVIEIALILVISDLSYRFLERPLQHFDYSRTFKVLKEVCVKDSPYGWKRIWAVAATLIVAVAAWGAIDEPRASVSNGDSTTLQNVIDHNSQEAKQKNKVVSSQKKAQAKSNSAASSQKQEQSQKKTQAKAESVDKNGKYVLTDAERKQAQQLPVTAVGDSVLADASQTMQGLFPQMYVDAKVGRQVREAIPILQDLIRKGKLSDTVLLSLGTNGPFTDNDMEQIMHLLGPKRQVYWINVQVPTKRWQDQVNQALVSAKKKYSNLHVIDWHSYSQNHPEWFYSDRVHPNVDGLPYFVNFVTHEMLK
ncbi:acyltransferase [Ligilactobacillus salitolerans]|uniref:Acyltransferase n=2 Tax=Ligilactobacillus salitolerans TaxID=1808352 RepID=A0A401IRE1_9LACO|nr:acyltransferase [Ligilactobacillus salitolerans]